MFALDQLRTADVLVLGRKTCEGMFDFWPKATGDIADCGVDECAAENRVFADADRVSVEQYAGGGGRPAGFVGDLKRLVARSILVFGSVALSMALMNANLLDEYRLGLTPVVLGRGTGTGGGRGTGDHA